MAQDYSTEKNDDLYAGTPPVESLKLILRQCVSGSTTRCVMVNVISSAYLHASCHGVPKTKLLVKIPKAVNAGSC